MDSGPARSFPWLFDEYYVSHFFTIAQEVPSLPTWYLPICNIT